MRHAHRHWRCHGGARSGSAAAACAGGGGRGHRVVCRCGGAWAAGWDQRPGPAGRGEQPAARREQVQHCASIPPTPPTPSPVLALPSLPHQVGWLKFPSLQHPVWAAQWESYMSRLRGRLGEGGGDAAAAAAAAVVVPVFERAAMAGEHGVRVEAVLPKGLWRYERMELDVELSCPGTRDEGRVGFGVCVWGGGERAGGWLCIRQKGIHLPPIPPRPPHTLTPPLPHSHAPLQTVRHGTTWCSCLCAVRTRWACCPPATLAREWRERVRTQVHASRGQHP